MKEVVPGDQACNKLLEGAASVSVTAQAKLRLCDYADYGKLVLESMVKHLEATQALDADEDKVEKLKAASMTFHTVSTAYPDEPTLSNVAENIAESIRQSDLDYKTNAFSKALGSISSTTEADAAAPDQIYNDLRASTGLTASDDAPRLAAFHHLLKLMVAPSRKKPNLIWSGLVLLPDSHPSFYRRQMQQAMQCNATLSFSRSIF